MSAEVGVTVDQDGRLGDPRMGERFGKRAMGRVGAAGLRRGDEDGPAAADEFSAARSPSGSTCRRKPNPCCNEPKKHPSAITAR